MKNRLRSRQVIPWLTLLGLATLGLAVACAEEASNGPATSPGPSGMQPMAPAGSGGGSESGGGAMAGGAPPMATGGNPSSPGGQGGSEALGGTGPLGGAGGVGGTGGAGGTEAAGGMGGSQATGGAGGGVGGAGGGTTGGTGGTAEPAPYNPCPQNGQACIIMPLGNSITEGIGSSHGGAYRLELFRLARNAGQAITFVGSRPRGPQMVDGVPFPRGSEGHSGWTIDDGERDGLYPQIENWFANTNPHIVTLMIGTNDVDLQEDVAGAPARLGLLLDRIIEHAPDALIVVAQIAPTLNDAATDARFEAFNAAIPALLNERIAAGKHLQLVDVFSGLKAQPNFAQLMDDRLHPNDAGYAVMAQVWYDAIGALFPEY